LYGTYILLQTGIDFTVKQGSLKTLCKIKISAF